MNISRGAKVLVTGGAGFIGSHLVEQLVDGGASVTVIDNLSTGSRDNLDRVRDQIGLIASDLGDLLRQRHVQPADYEYLFHLAANPYIPPSVANPLYDFELNLRNTLLLLERLRESEQLPRLINVSSAAVYGNPARLPIGEADPTIPISPYGVSKLAAERYVAVYSELYGIPATSLRLFSVYGPRQQKQVVYDLFEKLRRNPDRLEILGDGTQSRDFTYVLDVVQAMMLVATEAPGKGEVYNVASGATHTIAELAQSCCQVCELTPEIVYTGAVRPGDAGRWAVDIARLQALGFVPRMPLGKGLNAVKEWYERRG